MRRRGDRGLIGGLILVVGGILLLINQWLPDLWGGLFGTYFLLGLGIVFLVAGIVSRAAGWFIPGGILTGLGVGMAFEASSWVSHLPGRDGGWLLVFFAAGWFLIPVLTAIFTDENYWWAMIPGGIIGLVGLAVLFGGVYMDALEWVGKLWSVALIIIGALIIWRVSRRRIEEPQEPMEKHT